MPPPCASSALGAITQQGLVTSAITHNTPHNFNLGGTVQGYMEGHSATGCAPYRTRFNFWIPYTFSITKKVYANRHDTNPTVTVPTYTDSLDIGWADGAGGIASNVDYSTYSANKAVTQGGSGNPPIDFQAIFDTLAAFHSDAVPGVDNVPYTTYELTVVTYAVEMNDYLGHGDPFAVDTNAAMTSSVDYLP